MGIDRALFVLGWRVDFRLWDSLVEGKKEKVRLQMWRFDVQVQVNPVSKKFFNCLVLFSFLL